MFGANVNDPVKYEYSQLLVLVEVLWFNKTIANNFVKFKKIKIFLNLLKKNHN